jgi:hypothetical protein
MPDKVLFDFMVPLMRREGAWTIEPLAGTYGHAEFQHLMEPVVELLRRVPARISAPAGASPYGFAERGVKGRWMLVFVPDK